MLSMKEQVDDVIEQITSRHIAAAARRPFDESKHKRGAKGSGAGGRFVAKNGAGQSQQVQGVQRRLGLKADGKFGPKTDSAVRALQKEAGAKVDGKVGRQTVGALMKLKRLPDPGPLTPADWAYLRGLKALQSVRSSPTGSKKIGGVGGPTTGRKKARPESKITRYAGGKKLKRKNVGGGKV
jgi:peptidoglycan hydrolase-like protein with peptidoglycan-binding domain